MGPADLVRNNESSFHQGYLIQREFAYNLLARIQGTELLVRNSWKFVIGVCHPPSQRLLLIAYKTRKKGGKRLCQKIFANRQEFVRIDKINIKKVIDKRRTSVV